ncbi:MAG: hypothetical protein H6765_10570 [Candidatus Peribacteria bacterium]|nr:MAG: hypothetical protein H6765_10570 [Candidatus Peribacteria bacterium]
MCGDVGGSCGNGEVDPGEECDDGNMEQFDGCTNSCCNDLDFNGICDSEEV